ncbi:MAG: DUF1848 domain-containing protein [Eubacteriales bacterium]|nr:DUF1848 domain-containing protein [Eubacteriales bacterium]
MIIQTGNRTDIPAFYAEWFANRLREGSVMARNPFHPTAVTRYRLDPSVVDLIIFCTKNPEPALEHRDLFRNEKLLMNYYQYWFVTITPYGREIEPNVPDKSAVMDSFCRLAQIVSAENMCWRYDPILIDKNWTVDRHIEAFSAMCQVLDGSTRTCVISFIDLYEKVWKNYPEARTVPLETQLSLTESLVKIAGCHGMTVKPCGESPRLASVGADCSGCLTQATFEQAIGENLLLPPNPKNRKECSCYLANDIGQYNTCGHLCRYCYANVDPVTVRRNMSLHDPSSPLLTGWPRPEDRIHDAKQVSWVDPQMRLF